MFRVNEYIKTNSQQYPQVEIRGLCSKDLDPRIKLLWSQIQERKKSIRVKIYDSQLKSETKFTGTLKECRLFLSNWLKENNIKVVD